MKDTDASFYDEQKREIVAAFIQEKGIIGRMVTKWLPYFPGKAMRTLVESEIVYLIDV